MGARLFSLLLGWCDMKTERHESITITLTREEVVEAIQAHIQMMLERRGLPNLLNQHVLEDADFTNINRREGEQVGAFFFFAKPTESK